MDNKYNLKANLTAVQGGVLVAVNHAIDEQFDLTLALINVIIKYTLAYEHSKYRI